MKLIFLLTWLALVGLVAGHTYFSPLDFLRHERALVKLGEALLQNHSGEAIAAILRNRFDMAMRFKLYWMEFVTQ